MRYSSGVRMERHSSSERSIFFIASSSSSFCSRAHPAPQKTPITLRKQALDHIEEARVDTDQDARLFLFNALDNDLCGFFVACPRDFFEVRHALILIAEPGRPLIKTRVGGDAGVDPARMHTGDVDPCPLELMPERLSHPSDGEFRRVIKTLSRDRDEAEDAREVHDAAAPALEEVREEGFCSVDDAPKVHADDPLPILVAALGDCIGDGHARVIDDDIRPPICGEDLISEGLEGCAIGDVELLDQRLSAEGFNL